MWGQMKAKERRAVDFFLSCAGKRLSGVLEKDRAFWGGTVLMLAHSEPFIIDSVIAISTLYEYPQYLSSFTGNRAEASFSPISDVDKILALQTGQPRELPRVNEHRAFALRAYNRALQALRAKVESGKASPVIVLLSSLLFVCIELVQDNVFAVSGLLVKSSELLRLCESSSLTFEETQVLNVMKSMLVRLSVLAAAFGHPHPMDTPAGDRQDSSIGFHDMAEARTALFVIIADTHAFIRDAAVYKAFLFGEAGDISEVAYQNPFERSKATVASAKPQASEDPTRAILPATITFIPAKSGQAAKFYSESFLTATDRIPDFSGANPELIRRAMGDDGAAGYVLVPGRPVATADHSRYHNLSDDTWAEHARGGNVKLFPETGANFGCPRPRSALMEEQIRLEDALNRWHEKLLLTNSTPTNPCQRLDEGRSALLMYYHLLCIWLATRLSLEQLVFDQYTAHFQRILHHAEVCIDATAYERPVFTFEVGVVPPLYFVASKCRVPSYRRHALKLLAKAPRKEAMWGATSTAQLAARIIAVEEDGMDLSPPMWNGEPLEPSVELSDQSLPPEEQRVHNVEILKGAAGRFDVRVTRYRKADDGLLEQVVNDFPI